MSLALSPIENSPALANLGLTSPTILAPMQGVGAAGVRDLLSSVGRPGMICAPFLRITSHRPSVPWLIGQLHRTANLPLSAQLLGSHPEHLALAAKVLADAGADVVDLNLGCPTRQAAKKGVGAALLSKLDMISRIVATMRAACRCQLSVKIRIVDDDSDHLIRIGKAIEAGGADFLVVHPRTRHQSYRGVADWSAVRLLKRHLGIPVVGNGDLWYAADALRLMRSSGADAVMMGRPVLRNPFLFRQFEELRNGGIPYVPTGNDIVEHVGLLAGQAKAELKRRPSGPEGVVKEHIQFVLRAVQEPLRSVLRQKTQRADGLEAVLQAIEPLRDVTVLDMAADGPMRFERTPTDPS